MPVIIDLIFLLFITLSYLCIDKTALLELYLTLTVSASIVSYIVSSLWLFSKASKTWRNVSYLTADLVNSECAL